jgi:hypothetical protein
MATLEENDERRLRLFQKRVEELKNRSFFRSEQPQQVNARIKFDCVSHTGELSFEGFNDDAFRAAIALLRQFTLEKDDVHFFSVCKIIRRKCERPELVEWTEHFKGRWRQTLESSPIGIVTAEKSYDVKSCLDVLFYGSMAHTLKQQAEEWENLGPILQDQIYAVVQGTMFSLIQSLSVVGEVIAFWLDKPDEPVPTLAEAKEKGRTARPEVSGE